VRGEKTVEYRRTSPFWRKRVSSVIEENLKTVFPLTINLGIIHMNVDAIGVFICGKRIHRRKVRGIALMKTPADFSAQGKHDVDTKTCFAFYLGEELKICDCVCGCQNIVENPMEGCCNYCNGGWCEGQ
jgi:hypothetical protein